MDRSAKRSRQLSIFESFQNCGEGKRANLMEDKEKAEMRERLASAAEKRINSQTTIEDTEETIIDSGSLMWEDSTDVESPVQSNSEDLFPDEYLSSQDWAKVNESASNAEQISELNRLPMCSATLPVLTPSSDHTILFRNLRSNTAPQNEILISNAAGRTGQKSQISELNRLPMCSATLPVLTPSSDHTILFRPHLRDGCAPRPYPDEYRDRWDVDHVRMPCSPLNRYPVEFPDGQKIIQSRWDVIRESLSQKIESSIDLEHAIMRYNSQYSNRWNFLGLHAFLNKSLKTAQRTFFFETILPGMIQLALQLPEICTQPIPLLKKHLDHAITLSQKQIGTLLANAFFCTFPRRNTTSKWHRGGRMNGEYATYPDINCNRLFFGTKDSITQRNAEKLKCLLNYFLRITTKEPCGTVTFHRKHQQIFPNWAASDASIGKALVFANGLIETDGQGMLQMDFANSYVGGGVLGRGCVQEEIRFIICPELIISRLFTERLSESEALVITGVEQYNKYSGYGDTFTWDGDYEDHTLRDAWGRKYTDVVAIDALPFRRTNDQYKLSLIKRDLNKAYVGFFDKDTSQNNLAAVATGNWGCGAFKGYPNLKFLIQLMAASQCGRGMLYFTFGDRKLQHSLETMHTYITEKNLNVRQLWSLISDYCTDVMRLHDDYRPKLYEYIYGANLDKTVKQESSGIDSSQTDSPESQAKTEEIEETLTEGI